MNRKIIFILTGAIILIVSAYFFAGKFLGRSENERLNNIPNFPSQNNQNGEINLEDVPPISSFAENLTVPWSMAFLPNGDMLVTERPGRVNLIDRDGNVSEIATINVHEISESGLHGTAVDPEFEQNGFIYLYYTYRSSGNNTLNRVSRYVLANNSLSSEKVLVDEIPGAPNHDGGRIKFGPDGFLYITTGDAQEPTSAQDRNSLAGKILRVDRDGNAAPNNPFGTRVYSYGHRNPQGITWDNENRLWATEHGPATRDELNLIEPGNNYGWPEIQGDTTRNNMQTPVINSGTTTWAPAGAQYYPASPAGGNGSIFFTGLRGAALFEYNIEDKTLTEHLKGQLGRIRNVILGADSLLYIATSNRDGRGQPTSDDDKILRINPTKLSELE